MCWTLHQEGWHFEALDGHQLGVGILELVSRPKSSHFHINVDAETETIRIASWIYSGLNKAFKDLWIVLKLVFESCSPRRMLFRRLYNQPVVSKQLAGVPNSSTSPSLPPQQAFSSSVNLPLKGVEDFLDMGIHWSLLLSQIENTDFPFSRWTWTAMNIVRILLILFLQVSTSNSKSNWMTLLKLDEREADLV